MRSTPPIEELLESLLSVRREAVLLEDRSSRALDAMPASRRASAANLLHYLAVRNVDLRVQQRALARLGLSSLGRAEPHVLATLDAVIARHALTAVVPDADLVSLSFVGTPGDVDRLHDELIALGRGNAGVILKIEHRQAFEALPEILMRAQELPAVAVMVARGDLAVEVGYERLAEVQEEILLLCEAAHVPVIWATQVLESLAKHGAPTRAEITDAASASRAECVMLDKGPYIADTIEVLDDIVGRMRGHLDKRTPMLRRLAVAEPLAGQKAR